MLLQPSALRLVVSALLILIPCSAALQAEPRGGQDAAARSTEVTLRAFTEADARRLKIAAGSTARGQAAATAAALAGEYAWQLHAQQRVADAAAWFHREQQLRAESYGIWSQLLDDDFRRLNDQAGRLQSADDAAGWSALWTAAVDVTENAHLAEGRHLNTVELRRGAASLTAMSDQALYAIADAVTSALRQNRISAWMLASEHNDPVRAMDAATTLVHVSRSALQIEAPAGFDHEAPIRVRRALADALDTLGTTAHNRGRFDDADRHLQEALAVRQAIPEVHQNRRLHETLGRLARLYRDTGRLTEARTAFESALADAERQAHAIADGTIDPASAAILDGAADLSRDLGELLEAQGHYAAAIERYRTAEQQADQAGVLLASASTRIPQFERAMALNALRIRTMVPLLHARLGEVESAQSELRQLGERLLALGDSGASVAAFTARLGTLDLSLGNVERAAQTFEAAFDYFSRARNLTGTIYAELALATALSRTGETVAASRHADAAYFLADSSGLATWKARAAILSARLLIARGISAGVDSRIAVIRDGAPLLGVEDRAAGLVVEGLRNEQQRNSRAAADLYRRAVEEIEFLRAEPLSLERFYDAQSHYEPYEHLISLLLRDGNVADAFRYTVLSRSKELRESQDDGVVAALPELLPLVTEERELRSVIRALAGITRDTGATVSANQQALGKAVERWREVANTLTEFHPAYKAFVDPPSLADVQAALPADTALLAYVAPLDTALSILVITKDLAEVFASPVPPADLWRQIAGLRGQASYKTTWPLFEPDLDRFRKLYDALIAPAQAALKGKSRLLILPSRGVHYVPFPALARRTGSGDRYLIEDVEIVNLSGAALSAMQRSPHRPRTATRLTAVADPLGNLPAALAEVDAVARLFESPLILRQGQATKAALGGVIEGTAILHVAAHGVLDSRRPSASHLALAPKDDPSGKLSVGDIRSLSLPGVALVTLSACQASLGQGEPRGLAVSSLSDAFLIAGADSVVGTLWEVEDNAAGDLMIAFYRHLTAGACKASALRDAQISMLRRRDAAHPYFWAAFVLFGDWGDLDGQRGSCGVAAVQ